MRGVLQRRGTRFYASPRPVRAWGEGLRGIRLAAARRARKPGSELIARENAEAGSRAERNLSIVLNRSLVECVGIIDPEVASKGEREQSGMPELTLREDRYGAGSRQETGKMVLGDAGRSRKF